jgi:hypothetical protein
MILFCAGLIAMVFIGIATSVANKKTIPAAIMRQLETCLPCDKPLAI